MAERSLVQFTVMFLKETVRSPYVKIHKNLHTHAYSCINHQPEYFRNAIKCMTYHFINLK